MGAGYEEGPSKKSWTGTDGRPKCAGTEVERVRRAQGKATTQLARGQRGPGKSSIQARHGATELHNMEGRPGKLEVDDSFGELLRWADDASTACGSEDLSTGELMSL